MLSASDISSKVLELRQLYSARDKNMNDITAIREGRLEAVAPTMFSPHIDKSIIANYIDVAARDAAEMLAPLPSFNCSAANMANDTARKFADKKTTIIQHYLELSGMRAQMYSAADHYVSYGLMPFITEPDWVERSPRIQAVNPRGCYPEMDRFGRLTSFTRVIRKTVMELCALYPDLTAHICGHYLSPNSNALLEVIFYHDKDQWACVLPERQDLTINWAENLIDEPCIAVAMRPGVTDVPRGQFDDVVWIQLAKNRFSMMAMEAAELSIEAPIALPPDVQEMAVGPLATIRTNSPEKVRRVNLELEPAVFQENANLQNELMQGARYPQVRGGNLDASIITGRGVDALQGGYSSAIQAGQEVFRRTFKDIVRICLKMDERLWPNDDKDIRGQADGVPYSIRYRPSRDIAGDHSVDVVYGFAMGLGDPNRAAVLLLQMRGDHLISRDFTRRQFPFGINVTAEEAAIEVEELRGALLQSVAALAQSVPVLAQSGQDPGQILAQLGRVIQDRQKGKPLEDAIAKAFAPPEQAPAEVGQEPASGPMGAPASPLAGLGGGAAGQQGPPDIMTMLAGLNAGRPGNLNSSVSVQRQIPA